MSSISSIREVAKRAGVSLGTVSNVLNRPEIVAEETRRRVQLVIEEMSPCCEYILEVSQVFVASVSHRLFLRAG